MDVIKSNLSPKPYVHKIVMTSASSAFLRQCLMSKLNWWVVNSHDTRWNTPCGVFNALLNISPPYCWLSSQLWGCSLLPPCTWYITNQPPIYFDLDQDDRIYTVAALALKAKNFVLRLLLGNKNSLPKHENVRCQAAVVLRSGTWDSIKKGAGTTTPLWEATEDQQMC